MRRTLEDFETEERREDQGREWAKANQLQFGNFYVKYGIPCIELVLPNGWKKYLSAFRLYAFQVSDTYDGEGCAGDTPVFGLDTFASIHQRGPSNLGQESTVKFLIEAAAYQAIYDYCSRHYLWPPKEHAIYYRCDEEWRKFIAAVYDVVVRGVKLEDTITDDESAA